MRTNRLRVRPTLEPLEGRLALSGGLPGNDIGVAHTVVTAPHTRAAATVNIQPGNLSPLRRAMIFGFSAQPSPGSALVPSVVGAQGPGGRPLSFHQGAPFVRRLHPFALGYAHVGRAGPVTSLVTGRRGTTGGADVTTYLPGDVNGDGHVDLTDLEMFTKSYPSRKGDPNYNPLADANRNGAVGQTDAKIILRNMTPLTPKAPLVASLTLAPGQLIPHPEISNSGGVTHLLKVTVIGRTTPGSIVFADSGLGDYTYTGPSKVADPNGYFSFNFTLNPDDQLKNTEYLIIDPYGQQLIQAYPIVYVP